MQYEASAAGAGSWVDLEADLLLGQLRAAWQKNRIQGFRHGRSDIPEALPARLQTVRAPFPFDRTEQSLN